MLYSGLYEVARHATERGLAVVLGTNGTLLDGAAVRRLGECGVKGVGISLDSCAPAVHDAFRGVEGPWEGAVQALALGEGREVAQGLHAYDLGPQVAQEPGGEGPGSDHADVDDTHSL